MDWRRSDAQGPQVTVVGGGAWGTTLAMLAERAGARSVLVVRDEAACEVMLRERRHPRSLPGVRLPDALHVTADLVSGVEDAGIVILAIPTQALRAALTSFGAMPGGRIIVSAAKGIEVGTLRRPTEILRELLPQDARGICVLSGPNLATEIANGKPATTVVASADADAARLVQQALISEAFRIYTSRDVVGIELGGALKNVIAIGAGIGDGLDAGDNAKAAFMTRGIVEMARLGVKMGAEALTFAGLSGIGDLIATCSSPLSRNHRVGVGLAKGEPLARILGEMGEVAEGVETTRRSRTGASGGCRHADRRTDVPCSV